jgi:hypothetical protein
MDENKQGLGLTKISCGSGFISWNLISCLTFVSKGHECNQLALPQHINIPRSNKCRKEGMKVRKEREGREW